MDLWPPKYLGDKDSTDCSCKKGFVSRDQWVWSAVEGMVKLLKQTENQKKVSHLQPWVLVLLVCANSKLILNHNMQNNLKTTNNTA